MQPEAVLSFSGALLVYPSHQRLTLVNLSGAASREDKNNVVLHRYHVLSLSKSATPRDVYANRVKRFCKIVARSKLNTGRPGSWIIRPRTWCGSG